ncbi:PQ loop repeat-domain-containing protein [Scleroderma yunnanense]
MMFVQNFSELLGYISIVCWLGAQFPQILENIKQQSCESLALPFLFNWMLGDVSNLIGCLLTNQLPFQTYLAIYFCFIDCCLLVQYFYYGGDPKIPSNVYAYPRSRTASIVRPRSFDASHYRTLSAAAGNVAIAAAQAAHPDMNIDHKHSHRHTGEEQPLDDHIAPDAVTEIHSELDDAVLSTLSDSFHSDSGNRKRVSWSQEHQPSRLRPPTSPVLHTSHPSLQITSPQLESAVLARGRPLQRAADIEQAEEDPSARRAGSRASRRSAGMVFLGIWAFFGIGGLVNSHYRPVDLKSTTLGRVLTPRADIAAVSQSAATYHSSFVHLEFPVMQGDVEPHVYSQESQTVDRIIGRIFAWLCATLYLTSRLPQIWKNFVRKSVEGLSVILFVSAFLGNFFYVCSILTSPNTQLPPPASTQFLRESIPYLLGSGGTFLFDITIIIQSFIYRGKPPRSHMRSRGSSLVRSAAIAEEAALLRGDALACSYSDRRASVITRTQSKSRISALGNVNDNE